MTHLTHQELVDALEGDLIPARRAHLDTCPACLKELADLSAILDAARAVEVPEPSPLFFHHLSARVRAAVEEPPADVWALPKWIRPQIVLPIAGMGAAIFTLAVAISRPIVVPASPTHEVASVMVDAPLPDAASVDAWLVVADLIGPVDVETAQAAGVGTGLGTAERAALELNESEQRELLRLLRIELGQTGG
jgi:hypothetical protein